MIPGSEMVVRHGWYLIRTTDDEIRIQQPDSMLGFDDGGTAEVLGDVTARVHEKTREVLGELRRRRELALNTDRLILDGIMVVLEDQILEA
jgi:hypothetical protein